MRLRTVGLTVILTLSIPSAPLSVEAQPAGKVLWRVGVLAGARAPFALPYLEVGRQRLRELGYVEGQNIAIEYRFGEGKPGVLPDLAAELVRSKVDLIVAAGDPAIHAAKQATATIPIVMLAAGDPVGSRYVASLARPGGNLTGTTFLTRELAGKRLELLKEAVPKASRVAVLWNPNNPGGLLDLRETQGAARALGLSLQPLEVQAVKELEGAFSAMTDDRAEALVILTDPLTFIHRKRIAELAAKARLPVMCELREFVDTGCFISYGPSLLAMVPRAAAYVDKILKGGKPADLPVEQPTRFELVINMKTAKALGLTIPQSVLIRADQLIQ